jgi:TPR repeat protein
MKIENLNDFAIKLSRQGRYHEAIMVFNLALDSGDNNAFNDIGYTYELMGDIEKAKEYYSLGIAAGVSVASYNLGRVYEYGIKTPVDYEKAFELYSKALKLGYSEAAVKVAKFYKDGLGVQKDERKALEILKKGVRLDRKNHTHSPSITCLANYYEYGVGCKQSDKKTFKANVKAVKQTRSGINLYNLAQCYIFGTGTRVNTKKGMELLYESANKNYPDSYYQLAALYNKGTCSYKGTIHSIKNDDYSLFLLFEAYHLGSPKADLAIAEMSLSGDNPNNRVDIDKAIEAIVAFQDDKYNGNSYDVETYHELKNKYPDDIDWEGIENNPDSYKYHDNYENTIC